jgi:hypothetical protein
MMKNTLVVCTLFTLLMVSCRNNTVKVNDKVSNNDTVKFFQVTQYLQSQVKEVNGTPYFIYKIEINNNKQDSTPINTAIFNQLSQQFLKPDINDPELKPHYRESIFEDQTTKSFTISYATTNKALELQNLEILLDEDGQTVKRLFLRKFYNYSDSSAIEQLSWKPGESFQVNRSVQNPGNSESRRQLLVVWNKKM